MFATKTSPSDVPDYVLAALDLSEKQSDFAAKGVKLVGVVHEKFGVEEFSDFFKNGEIYFDEKKEFFQGENLSALPPCLNSANFFSLFMHVCWFTKVSCLAHTEYSTNQPYQNIIRRARDGDVILTHDAMLEYANTWYLVALKQLIKRGLVCHTVASHNIATTVDSD